MRRFLSAMAFAVVAAVASPASADLIANGGFETGDFTDWTTANLNATGVVTAGFDGFNPHSGTYFAALGNVGFDGSLSQSFADVTGATLVLTYYLAADGGTPSDFHVEWDGALIAGSALVDSAATGYVKYTFDVLATGSDTVAFFERNDPSYWALDDVSLNYASAVPEPASLALLGTGLVAAAGAIRRRKRASKA